MKRMERMAITFGLSLCSQSTLVLMPRFEPVAFLEAMQVNGCNGCKLCSGCNGCNGCDRCNGGNGCWG